MLFLFLGVISIKAQQYEISQVDTLEYKIIKAFNNTLNQQIKLYNGVSYEGYSGRLLGNAYLNDTLVFVTGNVTYDGIGFRNVPLMYDLVKDKVITQLYDGYSKLGLINEKVSNFTLCGKNFINVHNRLADYSKFGFFELSYKGGLEVLVKRIKIAKQVISSSMVKTEFQLKTEYFILKDSILYKVNNEAAIFKPLKSDKVSIKKYLKDNGLKFRKEPIKTLVSIATFYDQLGK